MNAIDQGAAIGALLKLRATLRGIFDDGEDGRAALARLDAAIADLMLVRVTDQDAKVLDDAVPLAAVVGDDDSARDHILDQLAAHPIATCGGGAAPFFAVERLALRQTPGKVAYNFVILELAPADREDGDLQPGQSPTARTNDPSRTIGRPAHPDLRPQDERPQHGALPPIAHPHHPPATAPQSVSPSPSPVAQEEV